MAQQFDECFIPLGLKLLHAAAMDGPGHAVDQLSPCFSVKAGRSKSFPARLLAVAKMVEIGLEAAVAAAEMIGQERPHHLPSKAGAMAKEIVHLFDVGYALGHQMDGLTPKRRRQTIGAVGGQGPSEPHGLAPQRTVKADKSGGYLIVWREYLDQRDKMGRIEWMADGNTPGVISR